jgi:hypothetical protein
LRPVARYFSIHYIGSVLPGADDPAPDPIDATRDFTDFSREFNEREHELDTDLQSKRTRGWMCAIVGCAFSTEDR